MAKFFVSLGILSAVCFPLAQCSSKTRTTYVHPGLLHTESDFARVKSHLKAQEEPWYTGWLKLANNANPDYVPKPQPTVFRGSGTENYVDLYRDAASAYANAIYWKITGNESYANSTANILDSWSSTLVEINGTSDMYLASGIYGYQLANAAEILRGWSEWTGLSAMITMLEDVFYPMNHNFLVNHNGANIDHYWANWDLSNLCTMLAIGILSDNSTMVEEAVDYFKAGAGNGALEKVIWVLYDVTNPKGTLGQGQEAGRDQGHALLDFALLGILGQQAYNQNIDFFGLLNTRILAGSEYVAKYNLNYTVPYTTYTNSDVTQTNISATDRSGIRPMWELLYAHYGVLKKLNAPFVLEYRDWANNQTGGAEGGGGDYGTTSGGYDQLGYGTLMYRLDGY